MSICQPDGRRHQPGQSRASGDGLVALGDLAGRIGGELDHLTCLALQVQTALSGTPPLLAWAHADQARLQGIDRITQSLTDLARLMTVIAAHVPADIRLPVEPLLSSVILNDLSHQLFSPLATGRVGPARDLSVGDVHWF